MSEIETVNAYTYRKYLSSNEGATAAAVEILRSACAAENGGTNVLAWAVTDGTIIKLRNSIKAAAADN